MLKELLSLSLGSKITFKSSIFAQIWCCIPRTGKAERVFPLLHLEHTFYEQNLPHGQKDCALFMLKTKNKTIKQQPDISDCVIRKILSATACT